MYCGKLLDDDREEFCCDDHKRKFMIQKTDRDRNMMTIIIISLIMIPYTL